METYQVIISAISSLGFPIVCCIALFKYQQTTLKELTEQIKNNTVICEKLCEKLDNIDGRGKHDDENI